MRWVYVSPHLDDAALCAGGLIYDQYQAGERVEIWTVLAGVPTAAQLTPYARVMHQRWATTTAEQTVLLRCSEDERAAHILGATPRHLHFLDAIYRTTVAGEALYGDPVGAPVHPEDEALVLGIADELRRRLRPEDYLICPLGIGNHADHVIVRRASEATGAPLSYIADFPYVVQYPESIQQRVGDLRPDLRPISEAGVGAWIRAVQAYSSQLAAVFGDADPAELIRRYWQAAQGINLWASF
ncbi:MAG TPA: PIG-L family deacetylase [Anaerolineales bacterium]|nr:PIG-L family deacetylase [Anaerolineales bacterium]